MESKIAQNCLTYSKRADQFLQNQPHYYEDFIKKSTQDKDFICGLGCNLNGWNNCYSLPTHLEEELAERICDLFPFVDKIKIMKTGSEACAAAVRIARAYTGRDCGSGTGYHGNANVFISEEIPGKGTRFEGYFKYDDLEDLIKALEFGSEAIFEGYSYCIIEPFQLDYSKKTVNQLKRIRKLCNEINIVLIFDEIITGFRTPQYSVSNLTGICPDMICLGKALGNGFPISIVGGRKDIMETPDYFYSGTFYGETQGLKEALKTLDFLSEEKLDKLWCRGEKFQNTFNAMTSGNVRLEGLPTRMVWKGKDKYLFWQGMNTMGWLLGKAFMLNFQHTEKLLSDFINDARCVLKQISMGTIKLIGP